MEFLDGGRLLLGSFILPFLQMMIRNSTEINRMTSRMEATTIRTMTAVDMVEQGVGLMPGVPGVFEEVWDLSFEVCCARGRDFASEEMNVKYLLWSFPKIRIGLICRAFFTLDISENKNHLLFSLEILQFNPVAWKSSNDICGILGCSQIRLSTRFFAVKRIYMGLFIILYSKLFYESAK